MLCIDVHTCIYTLYAVVQIDGHIYYETCKDIAQGTELLVWYGDGYLQFMGIPVALKEMGDGIISQDVEGQLTV